MVPMQINYSNKNMLLGAMIVGGWDPERGGQIYGVPIGGTLVEQAWTTDGSGSTYIWGYLDAAYRYVCSIPHMLAFSRCIAHQISLACLSFSNAHSASLLFAHAEHSRSLWA